MYVRINEKELIIKKQKIIDINKFMKEYMKIQWE